MSNSTPTGALERSLELSSQELLKANSAMRAVFERLIYSSMDGIFAFDREWRYTVWNPALERILGLSKLQTLGKSAFEVFPRLKESGGDKFYRDALAGKTVVDRDRLYIVPGTGEQIFIEGHFSPCSTMRIKSSGGLPFFAILPSASGPRRRCGRANTLPRLRRDGLRYDLGDWAGPPVHPFSSRLAWVSTPPAGSAQAVGRRHRRRGGAREVAPTYRDTRGAPAVSRLQVQALACGRIGGLH